MATAVSLFAIGVCAVLAPLLAGLVPRRLVPEVVLLLTLGVMIGPHGFGLASTTEGVGVLRELGLGMLFLLAGYEIELRELTGPGGRRALLTWLVCFGLALALIAVLGRLGVVRAEAAVAIALTSTALGTLLPILKDSGLLQTRVGAAVLHHGAFGELGPIVAMAVLLGTRGAVGSIIVLALFGIAAVVVSLLIGQIRPETALHQLVRAGSETTGQTAVRLVLLLLITFSVLAAVFDLDVVLGAFTAGFLLRRALPSGDTSLEHKLEGLAFGMLIPIFFVTSGMAIDPRAVAARPGVLVVFLLLILLVRGGPVFFAARGGFSGRESLRIALYGATGLPIIVAVSAVAVRSGQMSSESASLLVAGGAISVLLLPTTATLLRTPS